MYEHFTDHLDNLATHADRSALAPVHVLRVVCHVSDVLMAVCVCPAVHIYSPINIGIIAAILMATASRTVDDRSVISWCRQACHKDDEYLATLNY